MPDDGWGGCQRSCGLAGLSPTQVLCPPLCVLGPLQPPLGPIVDMLQYSQRDLDAAVRMRQGRVASQCTAPAALH